MTNPEKIENTVMMCWKCPNFKIVYEPLKSIDGIWDFGRAKCTKHDLVVDFPNHRKLKKYENRIRCLERWIEENENFNNWIEEIRELQEKNIKTNIKYFKKRLKYYRRKLDEIKHGKDNEENQSNCILRKRGRKRYNDCQCR